MHKSHIHNISSAGGTGRPSKQARRKTSEEEGFLLAAAGETEATRGEWRQRESRRGEERRGGQSLTLFGINPDTQEATGARLGKGESLSPLLLA